MRGIVTREREAAAAHWLSAACSNPAAVRAEWRKQGVALLPCGILFAVVRISDRLVKAAADAAGVREVAAFLNEALAGPVFIAPQIQNYYALVGARAARHRSTPGAECLGPGTQLGVPSTSRIDASDDLSAYWVVPMDGPGTLCDARDVARLVRIGHNAWPAEATDT
nr:hypothetical protein OH826_19300 [Streptomyces sp. NBC_00899]